MTSLPKGAVIFEGVSKRYRLGVSGTLRDALAGLRSRGNGDEERTLWALRDVSFRVEPGQALALIGPNGAGKTTALKLLSRITRPTSGRIAVGGRLSSLIELGAGFHPELTGRENIYLNGAILGLKRSEIKRKFDDIVAFSELERFIDTPVKRYSSGMYVRLGFAVAAHVEPDVLLVDEVLAVGDASFRQKCMERMERLRASGTTLLFVSHNMYQVRRLCEQALLLMAGRVKFSGTSAEAIAAYEKAMRSIEPEPTSGKSRTAKGDTDDTPGKIVITAVTLHDVEGQPLKQLRHDQVLVLRVRYQSRDILVNPIVKVRLINTHGAVVAMAATHHLDSFRWTSALQGAICAKFRPIQLASGSYFIEVRIADSTDTELLASGQSDRFLVLGPSMMHEPDPGIFVPNVAWDHEPSADCY